MLLLLLWLLPLVFSIFLTTLPYSHLLCHNYQCCWHKRQILVFNGNHCIIMATKTIITYADHCCFGLNSLSFFGQNLWIKNKTKTRSLKFHHCMKLFFSSSLSSPRHELLKIASVSLYCFCACINFSYTKSNSMLYLYGTFNRIPITSTKACVINHIQVFSFANF